MICGCGGRLKYQGDRVRRLRTLVGTRNIGEIECETNMTTETKYKVIGTRPVRPDGVDKVTGQTSTCDVQHVFIMAGASPRTEWLRGCVALDEKGFILTGRELELSAELAPSSTWPLTRAPQMLETSLPGVFAVGDVRAGNVKRVASAVGEGAISVHLVHRALAEL